MASRLLGRLLTSPAAFLLGGLLDFVGYWAGVLRARAHLARSSPPGG